MVTSADWAGCKTGGAILETAVGQYQMPVYAALMPLCAKQLDPSTLYA
jgi:hypothetical protein